MVLETILTIRETRYWRAPAIFVICIIAMAKVGFWPPITLVLDVIMNISGGRRSLPAETIDYVSKVSRLIGLGAPSDGFLGGCSSPSAAASDLFVRPGFEASSDHRGDDNGSKNQPRISLNSADRWTSLDRGIKALADEFGLLDLRPEHPGPEDPFIRRQMIRIPAAAAAWQR